MQYEMKRSDTTASGYVNRLITDLDTVYSRDLDWLIKDMEASVEEL